jgi:hypothetical protein
LTALSPVDIVTYAVYLLGGAAKRVDTEDVAVKASEIAPGRFSWSKYPDQINLELVRVFLSDAKKPDKGQLLIGSGKTGWSLTPAGLDWVDDQKAAIQGSLLMTSPVRDSRKQSPGLTRYRNEKARIERTEAWDKWVGGRHHSLSEADAREVFRIDPYTDQRMLTEKMSRLLDLLRNDESLQAFLNVLVTLLPIRSDSQ